ncbi:MAG: hypothetical protein AAF653_00870 [Chloroflexota bacterium]
MLRVFIQSVVSLHTVILCAVVGMRLLAPAVMEERPHLLLNIHTARYNAVAMYDVKFRQHVILTHDWLLSAPIRGDRILTADSHDEKLFNLRTLESTPILSQRITSDYNWSPDGRYLIYAAKHPSIIVSYDTHTLTGTTIVDYLWDVMNPSLSPDGEVMAFIMSNYNRMEWRNIYTIDLTSSQQRSELETYHWNGEMFAPILSPDGNKIAYVRRDSAETALHVLDIHSGINRTLMSTSEDSIVRLSSPEVDWLPGTNHILYTVQSGRRFVSVNLHLIDTSTGADEQLTTGQWINDMEPSPDGQYIAILRLSGTDDIISLYNVNSGERYRILPDIYSVSNPHWITLP